MNSRNNVEAPQKKGGDYVSSFNNLDKFRFLSDPVIYYEFFNNENKAQKSVSRFSEEVVDKQCKIDKFGGKKQLYVVSVIAYDYQQSKPVILNIKKSNIIQSISTYFQDEDRGDPKNYDIQINKKGEGKETEYMAIPKNKGDFKFQKEVDEIINTWDISVLVTGGDVFHAKAPTLTIKDVEEELVVDDTLPF